MGHMGWGHARERERHHPWSLFSEKRHLGEGDDKDIIEAIGRPEQAASLVESRFTWYGKSFKRVQGRTI